MSRLHWSPSHRPSCASSGWRSWAGGSSQWQRADPDTCAGLLQVGPDTYAPALAALLPIGGLVGGVGGGLLADKLSRLGATSWLTSGACACPIRCAAPVACHHSPRICRLWAASCGLHVRPPFMEPALRRRHHAGGPGAGVQPAGAGVQSVPGRAAGGLCAERDVARPRRRHGPGRQPALPGLHWLGCAPVHTQPHRRPGAPGCAPPRPMPPSPCVPIKLLACGAGLRQHRDACAAALATTVGTG